MRNFVSIILVSLFGGAGVRHYRGPAHLLWIALAIISVAIQEHTGAAAQGVHPGLDALIADIKVKTAALVASERPRLDALSPQQRLVRTPRGLGGIRAPSPSSRLRRLSAHGGDTRRRIHHGVASLRAGRRSPAPRHHRDALRRQQIRDHLRRMGCVHGGGRLPRLPAG